MRKWFNNKKGAISIIIALSMIVLMGFAAISIDVGWMLYHKSRLQNAADAAALAGARELLRTEKNNKKEKEELRADARETVKDYMVYNMFGSDCSKYSKTVNGNITKITLGDESFSYVVTFYGEKKGNGNKEVDNKIVIDASSNIGYFFAKVLGINSGDVSVKSAAMIAPLKKVLGGLSPFGVVRADWTLGDQVILKTDSSNKIRGNFQALALDDTGGKAFETCILNGSIKGYGINDSIDTEPGNIVGPTDTAVRQLINSCLSTHKDPLCTALNYREDCPRIVLIPLIESLADVSGRDKVKVVGFGLFFIEDVKEVDMKDGNNNKYAEITGTFIKNITIGETDEKEEELGAMGVKLVFEE